MIDPDFQEKLPKKPNYRNEMVTNDRFRMVIRRPTVGQWYKMDGWLNAYLENKFEN